jgi:hypothetical protein
MNAVVTRSYRKNLTSHGIIYMGGEELKITIKDISLTGLLAHLECGKESRDARDIFNTLTASTKIDMYLPELRMASESEVVRVDISNDDILLALEFKYVVYDVDGLMYKRNVYRRAMSAPGKILLNGEYRDFKTVNVSVDGLMINLAEPISVELGMVTVIEFQTLKLEGEIKVIWIEHTDDDRTVLGLHYVHIETH